MRSYPVAALLAAVTLSLFSAQSLGSEYIESFHSDIKVTADGDLEVTESIRVHAEGKSIRRGIYRDFPTRYRDKNGLTKTVTFELLSAQRNNESEPFRIKNQANGIRVYLGDSNVYLSPGFYNYQIRYRSSRQLGFFDDFDELYWNVTGNGWEFEIRQASARVILPGPASEMNLTGYTGLPGSTEQALEFRRLDAKRAYFQSNRVLAANEGMTIVMSWPKGLVAEPTPAQRRSWFLEDNRASIIVVAGTLILLLYYLLLWHWYGRDPRAGVVLPRYRPPPGYSPASMRFVERMGYDKACFTAAILNLAVKGAVEIDDDDGDFRIIKTGPARDSLAAGENEVLGGLFKGGSNDISIVRSNHRTLSKAIDRHRESLKSDYEKKYFKTNSGWLLPGVLVSLGVLGSALASLPAEDLIVKTIFVSVFTMMPLLVIFSGVSQLLRRGWRGLVRFVIMLVPVGIFFMLFLSAGFPFIEFAREVQPALPAGLMAMLAINYFFYQWLKAPTLAGRRLLDQIEGFKHYLQVAEDDEIALQGAPAFSTEIYETYLPYAIALDLENEWTARLEHAITAGTVESSYSQPRWYHGHGQVGRGFSRTMANSFSSAIAAAAVAPGSSSGSSGGSSGGGGGGGGGGGW